MEPAATRPAPTTTVPEARNPESRALDNLDGRVYLSAVKAERDAENAARAARKAAAAKERADAAARASRGSGARSAAVGGGWAALRQCESGGNYANKSNPKYRGAYQFSYATWRSVGGSGDPADASPAEQDMRAQMLYERSGAGQWPRCGRHL